MAACGGGGDDPAPDAAGPATPTSSTSAAPNGANGTTTTTAAGSAVEERRAGGDRRAADPSLAGGGAVASRLGFRLFDQLLDGGRPDGNVAVAPAAVADALAMVRAGAAGATAAELDAALGTATTGAGPVMNAVTTTLAARNGERQRSFASTGEVELGVDASVWIPGDAEPASAVLDALAADHGAGVMAAPLLASPAIARSAMADWLAGRGAAAALDGTAPLHLAALASTTVTAPWDRPFDPAATTPGRFSTGDGRVVTVPMMSQQQRLPAARGDGWQAVELPLVGRELGLTVIVGTDAVVTDGFALPHSSTIEAALAALSPTPVQLRLPRFTVTGPVELTGAMAGAGLALTTGAGEPELAGFGIDGDHGLGLLAQSVSLSVDEGGVGGAAVAAPVPDEGTGGPPPLVLDVDRPFLVVARDVPTGTILVVAAVVNPAG
jgi:serpin B